jgi:KDO2-lipid IV(A) lauroyltransferase
MKYVVRYRKEVITSNLARALPHKTPKEIADLSSAFYRQFSKTLCESMYLYAHPKKVAARVSYSGFEEVMTEMDQGRSVVLCAGHMYNWEWIGVTLGCAMSYPIFGVYKPLSNPYFDEHLIKARAQLHVNLMTMRQSVSVIKSRHQNKEVTAYAFAADQSPVHLSKSIWANFLNIPTAFYPGIDRFAKKYNMPVFYIDVTCPKLGHYSAAAKRLDMQDGNYVSAFARELENSIRSNEAAWLWSHKRWKHSPTPTK